MKIHISLAADDEPNFRIKYVPDEPSDCTIKAKPIGDVVLDEKADEETESPVRVVPHKRPPGGVPDVATKPANDLTRLDA